MMRLLAASAAVAAVLVVPIAAHGARAACPASNSPNELLVAGGTPQTAQVGKQFQESFRVTLANSNGCPLTGNLAGISIQFAAPESGASGTFASSGSNVAVVGTDESGTAVAPPFTANGIAGAYTVRAMSDYGSVRLSATNTAQGVASSLVATGPTEQSATVLGRYGSPLQATVRDADGRPVQGVGVTFSLGTGAYGAGATFVGGGAQATVVTNADGVATSPAIVANAVAGSFTATAVAAGLNDVLLYTLRNLASRTTVAADRASRTATVRSRYAPLVVRVRDGDGRPVEGVTVTFAIASTQTGAGATFAGGGVQATAVTDANGVARSPVLVANTVAGRFGASASVVGAAAFAYTLRNVAAHADAIAAGAATGSTATVGTRFPIRLAVTVTDADANPVAGAWVTFTTPAHGASAHFHGKRLARIRTNAAGVAVAPALIANRTAGGYVATARLDGTAKTTAFALVNEAR